MHGCAHVILLRRADFIEKVIRDESFLTHAESDLYPI